MTKPDLRAHAIKERAALLDLLRGMSDEQWATPSLCPGWSVRDVAVHIVSYDELSKLGLASAFVRGGFRVSSVNALTLQRYDHLDTHGVIELVNQCQVPRGLTAAMGCGVALTDGTIHHQDIRRAIGQPRTIPEDQLSAVLEFTLGAPTLPAKKNARGIRLLATDLVWSAGSGPEVTGPGESLVMAIAGRPNALPDLHGEGLPLLASRLGADA